MIIYRCLFTLLGISGNCNSGNLFENDAFNSSNRGWLCNLTNLILLILYYLISQNFIQPVNWRGVCPVRIVDSSKGYSFLFGLNRCIHQMGWIQRMDKIRRKSRSLFLFIYRQLYVYNYINYIIWIGWNYYFLYYSINYFKTRFAPIRLYNR